MTVKRFAAYTAIVLAALIALAAVSGFIRGTPWAGSCAGVYRSWCFR